MKTLLAKTRSWLETYSEITQWITRSLEYQPESGRLKGLQKRFEQEGRCMIYDLAMELADEFEELNYYRKWDGEFFDEVADFFHSHPKVTGE